MSNERLAYFNGTGYVVQRAGFPRTTFTPAGPVTVQGHAAVVGARQGLTDAAGFRVDSWTLPDTAPAFDPPAPYRERAS